MKQRVKWLNYSNLSFGKTFNIRLFPNDGNLLHSLDSDQHARRTVQKNLRIIDPDYYRFETHVLFDDAFEDDDNGNRVPNRYVKQLVAAVNVAGA